MIPISTFLLESVLLGKSLGGGGGENPKPFLFSPPPQGTPSLGRLSPGDGLVVASWQSGVRPEPPVGDKGRCLAWGGGLVLDSGPGGQLAGWGVRLCFEGAGKPQ